MCYKSWDSRLLSVSKLLDLDLGVDFGQNNVIITFDFDKRLVDFVIVVHFV